MNQPLRRRTFSLSVASIAFLLLGFFVGGAPAVADEYVEPTPMPIAEIVDVDISPAAVDVTEGPVDVTIQLTLANNESEEEPELGFRPGSFRYLEYFHFDMELIEGTERDGTWEAVVPFEEDTTPRDWDVLVANLTSNSFYLELGVISVTGHPTDVLAGPGIMKHFTDVTDMNAYYYEPTRWMVGQQITTGYKDGTFKPYKPVTRGEVVTFLYRYVDEDFTAPAKVDLKDVPLTHNFYEAISWATSNGVVNGYKDKTFRSSTNMTRAEVAAVLYRQAKPERTAPATSPFKDLTPASNQYEAITWLAENDITTGRTDGTFDPYANVTRAELATFLQRFDTVVTK